MPLMSRGSFDNVRATASGPAVDEYGLTGPQPLSVLREVTRVLQPVPVRLEISPDPCGLTLTGLCLSAGARVMLRRVADPDLPLRILCWSWDLGGRPPEVGPSVDADPMLWSVPLGSDGVRRLTGRGLPIVPPRVVVGGLVVRVILWQSERGADAHEVAAETREALRHSRLATMLALLPADGRTTTMGAVAVREAADELGREIAPVLRALCTDYLDFFAGCYPVQAGAGEPETITAYASEIALRADG